MKIMYSVNGQIHESEIFPDWEGFFKLDGVMYHLSDVKNNFMSEYTYWHPSGSKCDVRGCCNN